jgi:prepilin-type N-terminal cleavage/methylation domain-containing protein
MRGSRGFTIMEVLVVIALMAVIALIVTPVLTSRVGTNVIDGTAKKAADILYEAQTSAMAGRNGVRYGVRFEASRVTMFEGASYSGADPNNLVYAFPTAVTASTIAITGGGADIIFSSHKGIPVQTGSITFTDTGGNAKTLTINGAGMIHVQ